MRDRAENRPGKYVFDIVLGLTLLVVLLPLMLFVAILVRLTSPGPAIARLPRCGQGGRLFTCYKFRTMVEDASYILAGNQQLNARFAVAWKLRNDPRITPVGRLLRRTSLDELPQLFNVLHGDMSIVGPRPVQPAELDRFGEWAPVVTSIRPGITGLWQTSGRSLLSYDQRIALDVCYVQRQSFRFDVELILRTIPAVLSGRGAM